MSGDVLDCHTGGLLLASNRKRSEMLLNLPQCTGQSLTTNDQSKISTMVMLRDLGEQLPWAEPHAKHKNLKEVGRARFLLTNENRA